MKHEKKREFLQSGLDFVADLQDMYSLPYVGSPRHLNPRWRLVSISDFTNERRLVKTKVLVSKVAVGLCRRAREKLS